MWGHIFFFGVHLVHRMHSQLTNVSTMPWQSECIFADRQHCQGSNPSFDSVLYTELYAVSSVDHLYPPYRQQQNSSRPLGMISDQGVLVEIQVVRIAEGKSVCPDDDRTICFARHYILPRFTMLLYFWICLPLDELGIQSISKLGTTVYACDVNL